MTLTIIYTAQAIKSVFSDLLHKTYLTFGKAFKVFMASNILFTMIYNFFKDECNIECHPRVL